MRGVTEATMLDHDLEPLMQAGPVNMNLTIVTTPKNKVENQWLNFTKFPDRMDRMAKGPPGNFATR